ncbi:hypothetical protein [Halomonas mongoliensis]|uniref:hypothetical protein n=1 Tax=Halomonas mongoliensis TaxID=321265 RepID=UPI00403ADF2C
MDISWATIGKVMLVGIGTYILLPAFLVVRDAVLWWVINRYILTGQAQLNVRRYVELAHEWNAEHVGNTRVVSDEKGSKHFINGNEVTPEVFNRHFSRSDEIRKDLRKLKIDLDRRAKLLKWMLKHYQQESIDPINEWKKDEEQRLRNKS